MNRREFAHTLAAGAVLGSPQAQNREAAGGSLTDVRGIRVGHFTDTRRPTGCTAILFDTAVAAGVDYNGSAPGESHGRDAAAGEPRREDPRALSDRRRHFCAARRIAACSAISRSTRSDSTGARPTFASPSSSRRSSTILLSAIPASGRMPRPRTRRVRPPPTSPVPEGNVGAGAGATVGKMHRGRGLSGMKGGIGTASLTAGELVIGALAVVNAAGDILDWRKGTIVAGARRPDGTLADSVEVMRASLTEKPRGAPLEDNALRSTTLVVVATNATLTKTALTKLAMMANCGAGRAIRPYHTTGDGDQLFAISTGAVNRTDVPLTTLGSLAADVVAEAIVRGVRAAQSVDGWPGLRAK